MRWLLIGLLCGYSAFALAAKAPDPADIERLKNNIAEAQKRISRSEGEKNQLQENLRRTETELSSLERNLRTMTGLINKQQQKLNSLQQQENQLARAKQQQEAQMAELIAASYRMGREKNIKLLLNQENPEKLNRAIVYADYFNRSQVDALLQYKSLLQTIEENKSAIAEQTDALLANKELLVQQQQQLKNQYQERSNTLANLNKTLQSDQQKIASWRKEQTQLESLLRSVNEAVANIRLPSDSLPFSQAKGKLRWPAAGKRDLRFGKVRPPGELRWEGVAVIAPQGQAVQAVHHGRVVFADWFRGKGLLLIIDHGDGYMSLYAHNQTLMREPGDWVSAGETIATVGNSGGLAQAELYFEIRHQGKPLNPSQWLTRG